MSQNEGLAIGMLEATRLTRTGRLLEATAAIQRALGQQPVSKPRPQLSKSVRTGTPVPPSAAASAKPG